jgi:hypothetical protein
MEDVLEVYSRPYDERHPVVCLDEKPYQLLADSRETLSGKPGSVEKVDYEYVRKGTCSIFMLTEPLAGWRYTIALERRTMQDWANVVKFLCDEIYPNAETVVLVEDNLNTHTIASLYTTFQPDEALRLAKKLELHFTPKYGSWLNIAETELSALQTGCLAKRRIPSVEKLNCELSAWHTQRNESQKSIDWQFTTNEARTKLKSLYPIIKI